MKASGVPGSFVVNETEALRGSGSGGKHVKV